MWFCKICGYAIKTFKMSNNNMILFVNPTKYDILKFVAIETYGKSNLL